MLFNLGSIMSDPVSFLRQLLVCLPGVLLALCLHEAAHGWMAERCGDSTARSMGRITLNPAAHLDLRGALCMLLCGFGWAKPVPINPLNFRHFRRDDLKVSLAGIGANVCLAVICMLIMALTFSFSLSRLNTYENIYDRYLNGGAEDEISLLKDYGGEAGMVHGGYFYGTEYLLYSYDTQETVVSNVLGGVAGILFEMLSVCMSLNLSLAVFNLLPVPPLDGYHLFTFIVLKLGVLLRRLGSRVGGRFGSKLINNPLLRFSANPFGAQRVRRIGSYILLGLVLLGSFTSFDPLSAALAYMRMPGYLLSGLITRIFTGFVI